MSEQEKTKKEWLSDLVSAGVITKSEDWENLSIKQIQSLLDYQKPKLSEEDKKNLIENFQLSEEDKKSVEDRFYEKLIEESGFENNDLLANEIVKRRKIEQEFNQLKKNLKTGLANVIENHLK